MLNIPSNEQWAADLSAQLPVRWRKRLLSGWDDKRNTEDTAQKRAANIELRETVERLQAVRLPLDASDSDISARAEELAAQCFTLSQVFHEPAELRAAMARVAVANSVSPPQVDTNSGAIARMACKDWWRRGLRKMHAKSVEGAAIYLGYVNRARDCYVSNESAARRGQQIRRNARMLENTVMRNELEQEFTLAELASSGTANKEIRRAELMTRIAGFERIAIERKDGGLFLTVTCPSRMHKWAATKKGGRVFENKNYDGTTPKEAQAYLSRVYSRIRSKLARDKIGVYGFRIAEPHHDGCPHWHILIFHAVEHEQAIIRIFKKYALADSPDEPGAQKYRVDSKVIDWSRGTAAGYIAKYVAKNIDGMHVESDLYGNPAMESSARVEAWAATWGIRQFQQVGGAPVGVWRELRRVKDVPDTAPEHLKRAVIACNKIEQDEKIKPAAWDEYIRAQGGPFIGRGALIKLATEQTGEIGRYGELIGARPIGVCTSGQELYSIGRLQAVRLVDWLVKSVRHVWEVVRRGVQVLGPVFSAPWTRVNNCTGDSENEQGKHSGKNQKSGGSVGKSPPSYQDDGGGLCFAPA